FEYCLPETKAGDSPTRLAGITWKAGFSFQQFMDEYVTRLSSEGMMFQNNMFRGPQLFLKEQIQPYFYSWDQNSSI
ncbi:hypothetical protein, partial [Bacillus subtilis]